MDPKDILIPSKYKKDNPETGFDIALIGLSRINRLKVEKFLINKYRGALSIFNTNIDLDNIKINEISLKVCGYQ